MTRLLCMSDCMLLRMRKLPSADLDNSAGARPKQKNYAVLGWQRRHRTNSERFHGTLSLASPFHGGRSQAYAVISTNLFHSTKYWIAKAV